MPSSTSSSDGTTARRAFTALVAAFVALNAIAIISWLVMPLSPVSQDRYLAAVDDHIAMLESRKGQANRVILIGGSGAAFSISAEELGEELDRPVYNGGIQAGIGFRNLVDLYLPHLDPENDLIVLVPELELLADDARYSATWCDVVYLRKDFGAMVHEPRCIPNILHRTWQETRHHITGNTATDAVYRRSGFNAVGDLTSHLDVDRPAPDFSDYQLPEITDDELQRFEAYVQDELTSRGLKVLYIPAAMPKPACASRKVEALVARLSGLGTDGTVKHDPKAFCLPAEMFFDGAGHLNRKGRVVQTENVRRAIAAALADNASN